MTASKLATAAVAAAALALAAGSAAAQQNVRTATSWPGGVHLEQFAQGFSKQVDSLTGGKVKFQIFPAGTIGSPLKITESVQKKVAQAGHSWSGYDWGLDKTAAIFGGYVGSPPAEALLHWIYVGGGIELWRHWRKE
jgi:TRAP-type mannitol/chloroaromatic compound transport system substrate-binding protein